MSHPGPITQRVAASVRHLRTRAGMSAQAVADCTVDLHTPVNRSTLTNLENGRLGYLSVDQLDALASALNVQPGDLLTGDALLAEVRSRAAELRAEADRIEREAGL